MWCAAAFGKKKNAEGVERDAAAGKLRVIVNREEQIGKILGQEKKEAKQT